MLTLQYVFHVAWKMKKMHHILQQLLNIQLINSKSSVLRFHFIDKWTDLKVYYLGKKKYKMIKVNGKRGFVKIFFYVANATIIYMLPVDVLPKQ